MGPGRATVFVSYSREERNWCDRVRTHLQPLVQEGLIELWVDERMEPGDRIDDEIARALGRSKIAVLLMSESFMRTGSYALEREVPRVLAAEREARMRVFTVHVTKSGFLDHAGLKALLSVNEPTRPLAAASEDECQAALAKLTRDIRAHLHAADAARPSVDWLDDLLRGVTGGTGENIRAFMREYVGTRDEPVAFGGRAATMAMLLHWLDDAAGRPHCFLVAPTGLGKSAVVSRFVESLAMRADLAAVFLPVSLRFGTNRAGAVRAALVDRLAFLHGERAPGDLDLEASWTMLAQYLRRPLPEGRRLLLVLDGLDEAADWELPAGRLSELAPGTKVLISLRGAPETDAPHLRERLALPAKRVRVETVAPLDHAGVVEALLAIGRADLANDAARLERLFTLSEGDPLVLHLLLAELGEHGDDAIFAATPDLRTGLRGVWERQLTKADRTALGERGATAALFGILTCALGPIGRDDLLSLAPEELPHGATLDAVQQRWHRFVLRSDAGYSFFYPRLREFYADEMLPPAERDRWRRRLLDYGRAAVARLAADQTAAISPFVLRFHGAHLERYGGTLDDLAMLVSPGWRNAWMQLPVGQAGFVHDVERAWASAVTTPSIAIAVRCALTRATIRSEASNLGPELLRALVAHGVWSPARALAHLQSAVELGGDEEPTALVASLAALRPLLPSELLLQGQRVAAMIADQHEHRDLNPWREFAALLAGDAPDELERAAHRLRHDWHRCGALLAVAKALPAGLAHRGEAMRRDARSLLERMPRPRAFLLAVHKLSAGLADFDGDARTGILASALAAIDTLDDDSARAMVLRDLVPCCDGAARDRVFLAAVDAGCRARSRSLHGVFEFLSFVSSEAARAAVAAVLAADGLGLIVEFLRRTPGDRWAVVRPLLDDTQHRAISEAWIAAARSTDALRAVADAGLAERVLQAVRSDHDSPWRDIGLANLGSHLAPDEQLAVVERLSMQPCHPRLIDELVSLLAVTRPDEVVATLARASSPLLTAHGLLVVAANVREALCADLVAQAVAAARRVGRVPERLSLLADALLLAPDHDRCIELARELDALPASLNAFHRRMVRDLTRRLPSEHGQLLRRQFTPRPGQDALDLFDPDIEAHLLELGRGGVARVSQASVRALAYARLAGLVTGDEARLATLAAIESSRIVGDAPDACAAVVGLLPGSVMLERAFGRARATPDPGQRFRALAPLLPSDGWPQGDVQRDVLDAARASIDSSAVPARRYFLRHADSDQRAAVVARLLSEFLRECNAASIGGVGWDDDGTALRLDVELDWPIRERSPKQLLGEFAGYLSPAEADEVLSLVPLEWTEQALVLLRVLGRGDDAARQRRDATLPEVLRRARLRPDIEGARALAAVASHLPATERSALVDEVLRGAMLIDYGSPNADGRAGVLVQLAPHLEERHLARVIEIALGAWKARLGVGNFVARLPPDLRIDAVRELFDGATQRDGHHMVTAGLIAQLPDTALETVIDALERCDDRSALTVVIRQTARFYISQLERLFAIAHAASRRGRSQPHDSTIDVLGALGAELLTRSPDQAQRMRELVFESLHERASNRPELLNAIAGLAPLLRALVGPDGIDVIAQEVLDVTGWWP